MGVPLVRRLSMSAAGLALALTVPACRGAAVPAAPEARVVPTFTRDVAPIVFTHCAPCHRPGQAAPFTLLSYADVRARADEIADAIRSRQMPPWLPAPGPPAFIGERRLSDLQISTIAGWVDGGAIEGRADDLPRAPVWPEGWQLGTPDLVLTPPRPYVLAPGTDDVYRNVVLRVPGASDRYVRAVEFRPGDAPVHHAVVHLDRTSGSRRRDEADGKPGFDGMGGPGTQDPEGHFIGWAPGRGPIEAPSSMPWRLSARTDLVVELHLMPGTAPVAVQPAVALYFADRPAADRPVMLKMGSQTIDIPPGERNYAITDTYEVPVEVDVLSIYPHAHFLGRQMRVSAALPDGTTRRLLDIPEWSFHWQQDYRYAQPMTLPRGTTLTMRFTYDNSDANHHNPRRPPVRVMAGQRSTDEMGNLLLQLVPRSSADRGTLAASVAAHEALANLAGAQMIVRHAPADALNQRLLGSSYADVGHNAEAIAHLMEALRLNPKLAEAHNDLGGVLLAERRVPEALDHFRRAAALAPRDEHLKFNLAKVLRAVGQADAAAQELRRAIALNPEFAEAHDELGVILFSQKQLAAALVHLTRAAELAPESADFQNDLGGALAQAGRFDEALRYVRRALELRPDFEAARQNLERLKRPRR